MIDRVEGVIFPEHTVGPILFMDGAELEVIRIDTRGERGFCGDHEMRSGMSGGPIWNERTQAVVAVIEGKRPRGSLGSPPPTGYGIEIKHLLPHCPELHPLMQRSTQSRRATAKEFARKDMRTTFNSKGSLLTGTNHKRQAPHVRSRVGGMRPTHHQSQDQGRVSDPCLMLERLVDLVRVLKQ
jgi:hypothetical protein